MKIAIVGRHPDLEIGFNALMSKNWLKGFNDLGVTADLFLPNTSCHNPFELMSTRSIDSLDELERWGIDFDVEVFDEFSLGKLSSYDCVIWQSYRPEEDFLRERIKKMNILLAKNPPRLFSGNHERDEKKANGVAQQYDLVACSLRSDFEEAGRFDVFDSFYYVPRGFDTNILNYDEKGKFIIGFDKAVRGEQFGNKSIRHIIDAGVLLKGMDIEYYSLRSNIEELSSRRVPLLQTDEFYRRFLNKISIYMPINFDYSVHAKGRVFDQHGNHRYIGLYENQIIEAQLAGAVVISRKNDIPSELIMYDEFSLINDYSDIEGISRLIVDNYDNIKVRSKMVSEKARAVHSVSNSAGCFYNAIKNKIK